MCGVTDADCRRYHTRVGVGNTCVFDITRVSSIHVSNPPNWGGRRGKRSENRQRKSFPLGYARSKGRQLRIARYNYDARRHFKRSWQGELMMHPARLRYLRRKRQSL